MTIYEQYLQGALRSLISAEFEVATFHPHPTGLFHSAEHLAKCAANASSGVLADKAAGVAQAAVIACLASRTSHDVDRVRQAVDLAMRFAAEDVRGFRQDMARRARNLNRICTGKYRPLR